MKFEFKPVRKKIDLGEYAEEMSGGVIQVRVNVDRATLNKILNVSAETPQEEFFMLLTELWSEDTGSSGQQPAINDMDGVLALYEHCKEFDPQLWRWVTRRTWDLIIDYQAGQKKA